MNTSKNTLRFVFILLLSHCLSAAAVTLTFEGVCTSSLAPGSPQPIAAGDTVTLTVELDEVTNSVVSGDDVNYAGFTTYHVSLSTSAGYSSDYYGAATNQGLSVSFSTQTGTNTSQVQLDAFNYAHQLPGFTWDQVLIFLSMGVGSPLPGNTDGVPLTALLADWPDSPTVNGSFMIEPGGIAEAVDVRIDSLTVDAGTPPPVLNVPAGLADSSDPWPDPALDNWYDSTWFGSFYYIAAYGDWVWSNQLGTTYVDPQGAPTGVLMWSNLLQSWIWGSNLNGSWFYHSNTDDWIYIAGDPGGGCWIYWETSQNWTFVTPY